jgi:hypothetical protein
MSGEICIQTCVDQASSALFFLDSQAGFPADIQKAYGFSTQQTGAGQTLALFELDGYLASDITAYESNLGY